MQPYRGSPFISRNRKALYALALVVLLAVFSASCEKISLMLNPPDLGVETMRRDTVWKQRKSPYRITESFRILAEATLTIEPGVEILLGPDVTVHCYGRIVAEGTEEKPIRFRALGSDPWDKIDCFGGRHPPRERSSPTSSGIASSKEDAG